MLFGHPSVQEACKLKSILSDFSDAFGACINKSKSQFFFFHTPPITQASIARILGFSIASLPSKYLGAPMIASALKHSSCKILLEKLEACISSWTFRALNMASHLVLIKEIRQSVPPYLFTVMATAKWVLKAIKNVQRNFLWGNTKQKGKWALVKWETVCHPKSSGGTRLQDPEHSNEVMGARIWWGWLSNPYTPWEILWIAKNGDNARFREDSWQQRPKLKDLLTPHQLQDWVEQPTIKVNQLWEEDHNQGYRQWLCSNLILGQSTQSIKDSLDTKLSNMKIHQSDKKYIIRWGYETRGTFTSREAYHIILRDHTIKAMLWHKVWEPPNQPKISTFLWLLCQNRTLTWDNLRKWSFHEPSICPNCKQAEETKEHLLNSCLLATLFWEKVSFRCQRDGRNKENSTSSIHSWAPHPYKSKILNTLWKLIPGFLMWTIWKERNSRIIKDHSSPTEVLWINICQNIRETLMLQTWLDDDFPSTPQEQNIWLNRNLQWNHE
eukprot:PITA_10928